MSESFEVRIDLNQEDSLSSTLFNLALEKPIREIQMEITRIAIGQQCIKVLGFANSLNILEIWLYIYNQ